MKQLFVLAAIAAAAIAPAHAVVVTQWNFNSVTPDGATGTGTTAPAIGVIVSFLQIDTLTHKNSNRDKHLQNRLSRTRCAFGAD